MQLPNDSASAIPNATPKPSQSWVSNHVGSESSASCACANAPYCSAQIAASAASVAPRPFRLDAAQDYDAWRLHSSAAFGKVTAR